MLLTAILAAALCQLEEVAEAPERDLSFTVELTGLRQLGASGFVDFEAVPSSLFLNAGYTLLKTPALEATATSPAVPTAPTHIFSAGVDWTPGRHFSLSFLLSGSPRAVDRVVINPGSPPALQVALGTSRSSFGGSLLAGWGSGGLSRLEWAIDGGLSVTANKLGATARRVGGASLAEVEDNLIAFRGLGGLTLTIFDRTDLSLRGGLSAYSRDPLTAGRFGPADYAEIQSSLLDAASFITDVEVLARAAQQAATRIGQVDSLCGYATAPLWAEVKVVVRHRFTRRFSAQLGWTFNRYVPTAGHSNIFSTRVTFKLGQRWRVWAGGAVQRDEPLDRPAQRQPTDPRPSISGVGTVGGELTL